VAGCAEALQLNDKDKEEKHVRRAIMGAAATGMFATM
jgi:hypothetical protein